MRQSLELECSLISLISLKWASRDKLTTHSQRYSYTKQKNNEKKQILELRIRTSPNAFDDSW